MGTTMTPNYKNQTFAQFMTAGFEQMGQTIIASAYGKTEERERVGRTWWAVHTGGGLEAPMVSKTHWCQRGGSFIYRTEWAHDAPGRTPMPVSVERKAKALGIDVSGYPLPRES